MVTVRRNDPNFPRLLREIPEPPNVLYVSGDSLEHAPFIAIVGTRRPTRYGLEVAEWMAAGLAAAGMVVVSGLARGIDGAAHVGALNAGGKTIAVLGCGVDRCYPPAHAALFGRIKEQGCVISEFEPGVPALPFHFPQRNRIIAGMCSATVIVEGKPTGGAMITARLALDYGREVFAVAGPVQSDRSEGPLLLIRDGARLVTSPQDVLEDLGMLNVRQEESVILEPDEQRVFSAIDAQPVLLELIARAAGIPSSTASAVLSRLEVKGLVSRHPGGRFAVAVGTGTSRGLRTT